MDSFRGRPETEPAEALRKARRALDGLDGVRDIGAWTWIERKRSWALSLVLEPGISATPHLPAATRWHVLVASCYPWGDVRIYPAVDGGISSTFPHQLLNRIVAGQPWRTGEICVGEHQHVLGRWGDVQERHDAASRLAWRVRRALDWLRDAAAGTLALPGEPFELPHFGATAPQRVAFRNAPDDPLLDDLPATHGIAELTSWSEGVFLLTKLLQPTGEVARAFEFWGELARMQRPHMAAAWLRLRDVPVLDPYQAPRTYGELREIVEREGMDLDRIIDRSSLRLRRENERVLLIGFPIRAVVGGPFVRLHWQPMRLPGLRTRTRPTWSRRKPNVARVPIPDEAQIEWLHAESWDDQALASRGHLPDEVRRARFLVVGAGALGSAVAEMLVRGGCRDLILADAESVDAGNVARHTMTLAEVGRNKAGAVAARLLLVAPGARIRAFGSFPSEIAAEERLRSLVIVDTTGDDTVLAEASATAWCQRALLVSLSFDHGARRLFCFADRCSPDSHRTFREYLDPWLATRGDIVIDASRREGPGCWHPAWPGRCDHVYALAASGVAFLERQLVGGSSPTLVVYERSVAGEIKAADVAAPLRVG